MKYFGQDLMVFMETATDKYVSIAVAKNHTVQIQQALIDASTKDNGGGIWQEQEPGLLSWSLSTENLVGDSEEQGASLNDVLKVQTTRKRVKLIFGLQGDYKDLAAKLQAKYKAPKGGWTPDKTNYLTGEAYVTDFNLNAQNGELASASTTFTGAGPLEIVGNGIGTATSAVAVQALSDAPVATVPASESSKTVETAVKKQASI